MLQLFKSPVLGLLFGLCLLVPVRHRILAIMALIGLIFLAANLAPESTATRFYGDTVIFEFVAGVILGRIYKTGVSVSAPVVAVALMLGFWVLLYNDYRGFELPRLITIGIPANMHIAALRDDFLEFCDHLNLDAIMDPMKF